MKKAILTLFLTLCSIASYCFDKDFGYMSISDGLSQMSVSAIVQDSDGYMWFGTRDGLNRYDGREFKIYRNDIEDTLSLSDNYIKILVADNNGDLWIGTANGLNHYDSSTERFKRFFVNPGQRTGNRNEINSLCLFNNILYVGTYHGLYILKDGIFHKVPGLDNRVYSIATHKDGIVVSHSKGLSVLDRDQKPKDLMAGDAVNYIYSSKDGKLFVTYTNYGDFAYVDTATGTTKRIHLLGEKGRTGQALIRCITESTDGKSLIFGTYDGLRIYDLETGAVSAVNQGKDFGHGLSHYAVESIYTDRAGTLWVGTYGGGINHAHDKKPLFRHFTVNSEELPSGVLSSIVASEDGKKLWIGTDASGVISFDTDKEVFHQYPRYSDDMYKDNNVKSLLYKNGLLYAGFYTGKLCVLDTKRDVWSDIIWDSDNSAIYSIIENNGKIIIGRYSQYGLREIQNGEIVDMGLSTDDGKTVNIRQITSLCYDHDTLWIGTRSNGLYRYSPSGKLDHFTMDGPLNLSGNRITTIVKDYNGRILTGTSDGGLNIYEDGRFKCISHKDGLADNSICSIIVDKEHRLWVVTRSGISVLGDNDKAIRTFDRSDGIMTHEFSPNSCAMTPDGNIWIGGDNALLKFMPDNMTINAYIPPVVINSVMVNGKHMVNGKNSGLSLSHRQNSLTFTFSALNFIYPEKNRYSYCLVGADKEWQMAGGLNKVNYTNLTPGTYEFMVKCSNNDGVWNEEPTVFKFEILRPVWARWWALVLYFMIAGLIVFIVLKSISDRKEMRRSMLEKQKKENQYKAQIKLFTNFAHELRTPLTLIISPLEEILSIDNPQPINHSTISMIHDNAKRLLLMVNQLMDLRSKEEDKMKIRVAEGDIAGFSKEIFIAFNHHAHQHNINYTFISATNPRIWFDRNLFEKVLMNLLSNAFKFTPDDGSITLEISEETSGEVRLCVSDSGIGIHENELENIFNPFYRTDDAHYGFEGSGVGLSLVKSIVELHHGTIYAESSKGQGTSIHIILHKGNEMFNEDEIIKEYKDSEAIDRYVNEGIASGDVLPDKSNATILVVEDNKELRKYIVSGLSRHWNVLEASNGEEGRRQAIAHSPSLIISDVMMPVMDGLQMCQELKSDSRTSHIPIILLTARQMVIQMKEGLELGADDYITKPFNMQSLILKIGNIVSSREKLKVLYGQTVAVENLGIEFKNTALSDEKFLQQLNCHIDKFIGDSELNADSLCKIVGMSRATLYRRVVATTGLSPARYIQTVRLNIAAKMLENSDMSITDIAIATGFSSIVHFSSSFKKKYGMSPTQYIQEKAREQKNEHID